MQAIVVDVGNTRIKWGRCAAGRVAEVAALPHDAPDAWRQQVTRWTIAPASPWIVSGVQPAQRDALVAWLRSRGAPVRTIDSYRQLPLVVQVDEPAMVGIDRLLNAVAANKRRLPNAAAVIVDAGSAITVDYVDGQGVFRGGAIFPGLRLMSQSLHDYTALLPMVAVERAETPPGTSTEQAIRVGIFHATIGGIREMYFRYLEQNLLEQTQEGGGFVLYLTGGDAAVLNTAYELVDTSCAARGRPLGDLCGEVWPEMTLEGILHSVPDLASHG
jgi:type III pantothenate kinase